MTSFFIDEAENSLPQWEPDVPKIFVLNDLETMLLFKTLLKEKGLVDRMQASLAPCYFVGLDTKKDTPFYRIYNRDAYGKRTHKLTKTHIEEMSFLPAVAIRPYMMSL